MWDHEWIQENFLHCNCVKMLQALPNVPAETNNSLEGILNQASAAFKEAIGTLKYIKTRIMINENTQAKFHSTWPVLYILHAKVDVE